MRSGENKAVYFSKIARESRNRLALRRRCLNPAQAVNSSQQFSLRAGTFGSRDVGLERGVERALCIKQYGPAGFIERGAELSACDDAQPIDFIVNPLCYGHPSQ